MLLFVEVDSVFGGFNLMDVEGVGYCYDDVFDYFSNSELVVLVYVGFEYREFG